MENQQEIHFIYLTNKSFFSETILEISYNFLSLKKDSPIQN